MSVRRVDRLLLVFDANSGAVGAFVDGMKKVLMIRGCALCAITHGVTGERQEWKTCKEGLGLPVDYLHRDEVPAALAAIVDGRLPCVVAEVAGAHEILLGPDVLSRCKGSVSDFKGRLLHHAVKLELELPFMRPEAAAAP